MAKKNVSVKKAVAKKNTTTTRKKVQSTGNKVKKATPGMQSGNC